MKSFAGIPLAVLALWLSLSGSSQAYSSTAGFAEVDSPLVLAGRDDDDDDDQDDDDDDDDRYDDDHED